MLLVSKDTTYNVARIVLPVTGPHMNADIRMLQALQKASTPTHQLRCREGRVKKIVRLRLPAGSSEPCEDKIDYIGGRILGLNMVPELAGLSDTTRPFLSGGGIRQQSIVPPAPLTRPW